MYRPVDVVEVRIWDHTVGAVALDPAVGFYTFEYDRVWLTRGIEIAPLTMPTSRSQYIFPSLPEHCFKRLPGLLADALPDDFGNALIDAYLARHGVTKAAITSLDRLAYMGARGMGDLEFRPARGPQQRKPTAVKIVELVSSSRKALRGSFDGSAEAKAALLNLIQVGTSAGGARAKAVIARNAATKEIRSGQLPVPDGFEYWLLKLDGVGADQELGGGSYYGRIEYAYALMASAANIAMAECELFEENGRAHFMTKRWDRIAREKVHAQTLCGMSHLDYRQRGTHDYAQYFQVMKQLGLPLQARAEGFRRMVFNVLASNCDDHTKNFSFLLKKGGSWELAPAYDVTHAYNPQGEWTYQHLMSVNGKFSDIKRQDLEALGDRFEVPGYRAIIASVREAIAGWPQFARDAGLPTAEINRIQRDFQTT